MRRRIAAVKIFGLFAVVLAALVATPTLAKHGHASHGSTKATATKASGGTNTTSPAASSKGETDEKLDIINVPRSGAAAVKDAHAKAVTPAKISAPRVPATPVIRNAIGVTVVPHPPATPNVVGHPNTTVSGSTGGSVAGAVPPKSNEAKTNPVGAQQPPIVSASIGGQGKIGGTTLIHPTAAPLGLGGPAKIAPSINGTTIRSKHN
jgi:hypothetical protein